MSLIDSIKDALKAVWDLIKKISVKILNWAKNIVSWFQDPQRLGKLKDKRETIAVSIKENLENGNFNVINCLYDKESSELIDIEEDTLSIEATSLDRESILNFGDKEMLILE